MVLRQPTARRSQSSTDDYGSAPQPSGGWYGPAAASRDYYGSKGKGESGGERWYGGPSKGERYEGRSRSDGGDTRFAEANERKRSTSWWAWIFSPETCTIQIFRVFCRPLPVLLGREV